MANPAKRLEGKPIARADRYLPAMTANTDRLVEVDQHTTGRPKTVQRLRDWEYLERQLHRLIVGWARYAAEWEDIITTHRHIWEQAECVRRLRERLLQFPGSKSNLTQPVSSKLEDLCNAALDAPTHYDAVEGIYGTLAHAINRSYAFYAANAHPIHDAPTLELINEILRIKEGFRLWLHAQRQRWEAAGLKLDEAYQARINDRIAACGDLFDPLPPTDPAAAAAGGAIDFRLPRHAARPAGSAPNADPMPFV